MDVVYTNSIAINIHALCLRLHATPDTYTQDPVKFRHNMETCFTNVLDQHKEVMRGIEAFTKAHPHFR